MNQSEQDTRTAQLIQALGGSWYAWRRAAADLIESGSLTLPAVRDALNTTQDPTLRERLIAIFGRIEDASATELLQHLLISSEDPLTLSQVCYLLHQKGQFGLLTQAFVEHPGRIRAAVVRFLTSHPDPVLLPGLMEILTNPSPVTQFSAVTTLSKFKHPAAGAALAAFLERPESQGVGTILQSIHACQPALIPTAFRSAFAQGSRDKQLQLLTSLYVIRASPHAAELAKEYTRHADAQIRARAIYALRLIQAAEMGSYIAAAGQDEAWEVRKAAAGPGHDQLELLFQLIDDPVPAVRAEAASSLKYYRGPLPVDHLLALLWHNDPQVVREVVVLLEKRGDPSAVDALFALLATAPEQDYPIAKPLARFCGPGSIPRLLALLESGPLQPRIVAVEVLGRLRAHEALPQLLARLESPDAREQTALAHALAVLVDEPTLVEVHHHFLAQPPAVRTAWAYDLAKRAGQGSTRALLDFLEDDTNNSHVMVELGRRRCLAAVEPLIARLAAGHENRHHAAAALGKIGHPKAVEPIIELLHQDQELHISAARALGRLNDDRAVSALIEELRIALLLDELQLAYAVVESLGQLRSALAAPLLLRALDAHNLALRTLAAWALRRVGAPSTIPGLMAHAQEAHPEARRHIIAALAAFHDPQTTPALVDAAQAPEAWLRTTALQGLAHSADARAIACLAGILFHNENRALSRLAGQGLARTGAAALPLLLDGYAQHAIPTRLAIVWIIGKIGEERGIAWLIQTLEQEPAALPRSKAAQMLGRLKSARAIPALRAALHDPSSMVVLPAIFGLVRCDDPERWQYFRRLLDHPSPRVRRAAQTALGI